MGGIAEGAGVKNARYNAKTPGARPEGRWTMNGIYRNFSAQALSSSADALAGKRSAPLTSALEISAAR